MVLVRSIFSISIDASRSRMVRSGWEFRFPVGDLFLNRSLAGTILLHCYNFLRWVIMKLSSFKIYRLRAEEMKNNELWHFFDFNFCYYFFHFTCNILKWVLSKSTIWKWNFFYTWLDRTQEKFHAEEMELSAPIR